MKQNEDDKLRDLFRSMNKVSPSYGFENRLMREIHIVAHKKQQRKKVYELWGIVASIAAMIILPLITLFIMGVSVNMPEIEPQKIEFPALMLLVGGIVLLLLIADMLIHKRIMEKHNKSDK